MKNLVLAVLLVSSPLIGQSTVGWHRVNQVIARGTGVQAVVVPQATVAVTNTDTGLQATIYSDPLLTAPILPSVVYSDNSGNYDYYLPINYCVNETVTYPGSGGYTTINVCGNTSPSGVVGYGTAGPLAYYPSNGYSIGGENFASVSQGGSGRQSATAYTPIIGGTTSTGAHQSVASTGTAGWPLLSGGASALPAYGVVGIAGGGTGKTTQPAAAAALGVPGPNYNVVNYGAVADITCTGTSSTSACTNNCTTIQAAYDAAFKALRDFNGRNIKAINQYRKSMERGR